MGLLLTGFRTAGHPQIALSQHVRSARIDVGSLHAALVASIVTCAGCAPERYAREADRDVARVLERRTQDVVADREERAVRPEPAKEPGAHEVVDDAEAIHLVLGLRDVLELAVRQNREYKTRIEGLYLTALSLLGSRHTTDPIVSSLISYLFTDFESGSSDNSVNASIDVSKLLPTGGVVSAGASTSLFPDSYSTSVGIQLSQPLMRGAGYEVSHAGLIQAERSLVYEIRNFELFREDFAIDVATRFYDLVRSGQQIDNQMENLERAEYDRRKAEALFKVDRVSELEVLRAKRQELNSQNALIAAEESYEFALESFRIFLALPETTTIEIKNEPPEYVPVSYDVDSAVAVALENRLDIINRREQLEDSRRSVRIARDGLRPDLDFTVSGGISTPFADSFEDQSLSETSYSAGLTYRPPLDRVGERNSYRSAQISLDQAERGFHEFVERVRAEIRSSIRELVRRESSVAITREIITGEEKNKRIAERRFERGEIDNRELVDAEQSLLDARNNLIDEIVRYELARLSLMRDLGILFVDEQGMWKE